MNFYWQNLNDRTEEYGSGLKHGRCWWRFDSKWHDGRTIRLEWNFWTHFCGIHFDVGDDGITLFAGFPPIAFWLTLGMHFWPLTKWPRRALSETYKDTMVIDERECGISIHDWTIYIKPWCKSGEWAKADPWWVRGVSFSINPFAAVHQRHEVRRADGSWTEHVGSWEPNKTPDGRECFEYPYRYVLKNGTVQDRIATVHVERWARRPRCLQWTRIFEKVRTSIDIRFNDEVGEKSGSWKGGCVGCGWSMLHGETPEQALRRMEAVRKF